MTDDPDSRSLPTEDLAQLRERAAAAAARTRELIGAARAIKAHAVSLCTESAMLVEEMHFRQMVRRKVDPFP